MIHVVKPPPGRGQGASTPIDALLDEAVARATTKRVRAWLEALRRQGDHAPRPQQSPPPVK